MMLRLHRRALLGPASRRRCCRVMKVSTLGVLRVAAAPADPCAGRVDDAELTATIVEIHRQSRGTYGSPRVHAELRLGLGHPRQPQAGRAADAQRRLSKASTGAGVAAARRRNPTPSRADDLVHRQFRPTGPDRLWVQRHHRAPHRRGQGLPRRRLDAWSRRVVGWSIADHLRAELVVDALEMALWRRRPTRRHDRALRSRHPIHLLGVRPTPPRRRPARLDGHRRRRARQRRRRELLRHAATRAPRPPRLDDRDRARRGRSSTGSNASTTRPAATRPSACSAPSTTKTAHPRHDHHTQPVRETGGTPLMDQSVNNQPKQPSSINRNSVNHQPKPQCRASAEATHVSVGPRGLEPGTLGLKPLLYPMSQRPRGRSQMAPDSPVRPAPGGC